MRHALIAIHTIALGTGICCADTLIESHIDSVGLFKNGHAVITRQLHLPGPGVYTVAAVPDAVHSTFWVESDVKLHIRTTSRITPMPIDAKVGHDLQGDLAGREVVIRMRESDESIHGRVVNSSDRAERNFSTMYEQPHFGGRAYLRPGMQQPVGQFLILETPEGHVYVDRSMIATLRVNDSDATVMRRQNVLEFHVPDQAGGSTNGITVAITYLTKGMAWAPSYRIALDDSGIMALQQQAIIRNELEDIADAEFLLISGFPNIQFSHVTSPLSANTSLADFFSQLSRSIGSRHAATAAVMSQVVSRAESDDSSVGEELTIAAEDLHYHSIGRFGLNKGDSLMVITAQERGTYERIIAWTIPIPPDRHSHHHRHLEPDDEGPWESIRFENPLDFPMTTAPTTIVENGHFKGQRLTYWTSAGEQLTVPVSKALSIQTSEAEYRGDILGHFHVGRVRYSQTEMIGELSMTNRRSEPVTMTIRKHYDGELISADADAESRRRPTRPGVPNTPRELVWTLTLEPGQTKELNYRYSTLVPR